jgi:hypothetical protein
MSLQTIINNSTFITFDQKKVAGQSMSRSGRLLTAELASVVPFKFTVGMHEGLKYSTNRDLISSLDQLDITEETTINIGSSNSGMAYITNALGDAFTGTLTATSASGSTLVVNTSSASGSGNLFKKGDLISLGSSYRYPYFVTADVAWSGSSVSVPLHRPFIAQDGYTVSGKSILIGKDVTWTVKLLNKPAVSVVPHDRAVFASDFELIEVVRKEDG